MFIFAIIICILTLVAMAFGTYTAITSNKPIAAAFMSLGVFGVLRVLFFGSAVMLIQVAIMYAAIWIAAVLFVVGGYFIRKGYLKYASYKSFKDTLAN